MEIDDFLIRQFLKFETVVNEDKTISIIARPKKYNIFKYIYFLKIFVQELVKFLFKKKDKQA